MKKIVFLVILIVALGGFYKFYSIKPASPTADDQAELIIFWGNGCPHCEKVKEYISTNKLEEKIKISFKEVYDNKANLKIMENTVQKCPEIDTTKGIGVPLAFDLKNQKCLYGDEAIITWFDARK